MTANAYRHPGFLSDGDHPINRIRCPIHGFIHYSDNEREIIDHPLFRRLRHIRQLALTEYVYPGATHTRFEHSLGVMEIATRAFDSLAARRGDLLEKVFKTVSGFEDHPLEMARQVLRLAALLHDVGHASFSHAAEKVVNEGVGHEDLGIAIVETGDLLGQKLDNLFWQGCSQYVGKVIKGGRDLAPQLQIVHDLISGQMDADRTDYLLRDSHYCGVDYGRFDHHRLIECLDVDEVEPNTLEMTLTKDGLHSFEALILARYHMNTQVYCHRLRAIYDEYLISYHKSLGEESLNTPQKVIEQNDVTMMAKIMRDAEHDAGDRGKWAKRIVDRNHHRVVHDTGVNARAMDLRRSKEVLAGLQTQFPEREFLWVLSEGSIHKLLMPDDAEDTDFVKLNVVGSDGRSKPIAFVSQVLGKVPREFQCARIFADVARRDELRKEIADFANSQWRDRGG
jgi:uncharacterized protein